MTTIFQNKFIGGNTKVSRNHTREGDAGVYVQDIAHFDVETSPDVAAPYRDFEANEDKNLDIRNFVFAQDGVLYGYGVVDGTGRAKVHQKVTDTITGPWTSAGLNSGTSGGTRNTNCFIEYKGHIFGFRTGNLWRYTTATDTMSESYQSISFTDIAQAVIHPTDDICYFFHDNKISRLDNTTFTANVVTLPSHLKIVSAVPYNNYLVIGCTAKIAYSSTSVVYVWNRNTSTVFFDDVIEVGKSPLFHLGIVDGQLITVQSGLASSFALQKKDISIKVISGRDVRDVISSRVVGGFFLSTNSILSEASLYFGVAVSLGRSAIYRVHKNLLGQFALTKEYAVEDVNASSPSIQNIYPVGDYWFVAHSGDGSVERTNDDPEFGTTSYIETQVFTCGESHLVKNLNVFSLQTTDDNGEATVKYKVDGASEWTTLGTKTNTNELKSIFTEFTVNSAGVNVSFNEIQFRIERTGGGGENMGIVGYQFRYEKQQSI